MFATFIDFLQKLIISMFSGFANKRKSPGITNINITKNRKSIIKNVHTKNLDTKGNVNTERNFDSKIENIEIK